jgi:Xaa-Pro aminopeptidase
MFSAEIYKSRRIRLAMDLQNNGIILLAGNNENPINYKGNVSRFRQDSNFLYFMGIDLPGLMATIDTANGNAVLYGNENTVEDAVWTGEIPKLSHWAELSGLLKSKPLRELDSDLKKANKIHYLPPYPSDRKIFLAGLFNKSIPDIEKNFSLDLAKAIIAQRSIKSDEEVAQIEDALNRATSRFHIDAMKMAKSGEYEYRIAGHIESTMLKNNCTPAFGVICSVHGEILHNVSYTNMLNANQLLLVDAGAENAMHYASDITRTTPVNGKFSERQKNIYEIVLKASTESIAAIKPGITYKTIHLDAAKIIARGLIDLGLMRGNADEIVEKGAHALFFPHGLGHMMGLDVHDMEDLGENNVGYDEASKRSELFGTAYLRLGRTLQTGFVLTVEPGIYFIPALIQQWRSEKKFNEYINYQSIDAYIGLGGIRIEDDVLVTKSSNRVLGNPIPKTVKEIEALFLNS